ncbi:phospho-N-acetylmuramoyl-pentapeptide-transferase [Aerococcus kribbianus]|uniref:Phospho-N-acetylmuramoyl-pentapeptide-transferase n=1 Tax=Aerococcus kribbianus TaxID=2999064 RepID=A0A9X3FPQ7_9LACT|nr:MULTISPECIES: phospho-N-acetylmuramoyl-pentapeptide-transferase [unclassified Aerococcus]MCZ0717713.1 phospho-N-acetylmuramoyl-pentapeptide-transferase [Aerococcus sp. YH-aer221]MCZ0726001.1 phospho-N-acetylmuramoyl-pentapeptide-transferase [Aerococcus sp. YH-aer222]
MLLAFIISLLLTLLIMPFFIRFMRQKQFGQVTREEGPAWHQAKSGTPTMGGVVFIFAICLSLLLTMLFNQKSLAYLWVIMLALVFFAGIGYLDDFLKIFKQQNEGLSSKQKFLLQLLGSALMLVLFNVFDLQVHLPLPFIGELQQPLILLVFLLIWMTGFSNAFNLTDGLDGLSSGCGIISFLTFAVLAWREGQVAITIACLAIVGGLIGFIAFNVKPAKIFMGDAGSLALGAVLAVISVLLNNPWSLLLVGLIYIIETLSVMIQVTSYKLTKRRVFLMSPIHHHFEMKGWSEWKVDIVFWTVQLLASLLALLVF